jgi:Immunity protein Imm5
MQLDEAIQAGLEHMKRDPFHALSPYFRNLIYNCIGPLSLPKSRCIRTHLAVLAAKKVLPLWAEERPFDTLVETILEMASASVWQQTPTESVEVKAGEFWDWLTNDYGDRKEELSSKAFFAMATALEALYLSLGTDRFLDTEIDMDTTDDELDPWCSDAPMYAAIAYAGKIGEKDSSSEKRQAFWEWWLTDGISNAVMFCNRDSLK